MKFYLLALLTLISVNGLSAEKAGVRPAMKAVSMVLDTGRSVIRWKACKVVACHHGTLNLKEGAVRFAGIHPVDGTFTMDMTSIKNEDLTDADSNAKLIKHLKSADFFNVEAHPVATLKITKITGSKNVDEAVITADLTIKGITNSITFPALVKKEKSGFTATGKLQINRTQWDIKYNSGSFFDPKKLGDKMIKDDIEIEIDLKTAGA